jgi:hypothetical protein
MIPNTDDIHDTPIRRAIHEAVEKGEPWVWFPVDLWRMRCSSTPLSPQARDLVIVLGVLMEWGPPETPRCSPGRRYLADALETNRAGVAALLDTLTNKGLIRVEPGRGRGRPSTIWAIVEAPAKAKR